MATQAEAKTIDDVMRYEFEQDFNREEIVVSNGVTVAVGDACQLDSSDELILAKSAATNEVQTVSVGGTLTAGTGKLSFQLPNIDDRTPGPIVETDGIAFNAALSAAQSAIDDVLGGTNKVVVGGTIWSAMTLTFSGTGYAGLPQPMVGVDPAALVGATTVDVTQTTEGHTAGGDATHICLSAVVGNGTLKAITIARGPCIYNADQLGVVSGGKANAVAALKALGIVGRDQPAQQTTGAG